eukprot:6524052-Alexandrium_andersonii.AAC.1
MVEIKDWLAEKGVDHVSDHLRPKPSEIMHTCRVLTWKEDSKLESGHRAKARPVIMGLKDPRLRIAWLGEDP